MITGRSLKVVSGSGIPVKFLRLVLIFIFRTIITLSVLVLFAHLVAGVMQASKEKASS